ncbi:hypothetical protein BKA70DRAFT_1234167 [Coprinopsis sp. MPI-PUGE-AT-0042]|nr:hypothetical protein BKA70DRAFT_1234167 [Coprinopsis sp. MPI-PUGE-AT-0042]
MPYSQSKASSTTRCMPSTQFQSVSATKHSLEHYIRRIQAAQAHTTYSPPEILHWNETKGDLGGWFWPASLETGERITPSDLEGHRRTHYFMAPCCLCAISREEAYVEAKIGLVVVPVASGSARLEVNGEYVAQCALNRCGYFVPLERFYARKTLQVKAYPKRAAPLSPEQLVYISDFDRDAEANLGLSQALPSSGIWMRGSRDLLKVEAPVHIFDARQSFTTLWARGLQEDAFWSLFVQCSLCRMVMPKDVFSGMHGAGGCKAQVRADGWPMNEVNLVDTLDEGSISGDTEIIDWDADETDDELPLLGLDCSSHKTPRGRIT